MAFHEDELLRDVVEGGIFVKGFGVLGVERFTHKEAVKPHLRGINLFVPETAFRSARMRLQLLAEESSSLSIFLLAGSVVKKEQIAAWKKVVDVVIGWRISSDRAVVRNEMVHAFFNEREVLLVACRFIDTLDAFEHEAVIVGPL